MHSLHALSFIFWLAIFHAATAHPTATTILESSQDTDNNTNNNINDNNNNNNNNGNDFLLLASRHETQSPSCIKPATPAWCEKKGSGAKLTCMPGIAWFCTWTDPRYGSPAYALTNMTCEGCNAGD